MRNALTFILTTAVASQLAAATPALKKKPHVDAAPAPVVTNSLSVVGGSWVSQGPGPINFGQAEGMTNRPVIGAIQTIVAHPQSADTLWIGAVNGGIWKTTNATASSPTWTALGDSFPSMSIGAMNLDPTDGTFNTIVAAGGRFSSLGSVGGPRGGLFRTTDGTNFTSLAPATLAGRNVTGIAARGSIIVVAVNFADSFTCNDIGIWRSTNTGGAFSIVSGASLTGLPRGRAFDLAGDPTNNAILYTAIRDTSSCGSGTNGIYRSIDTGATWTRVSDATIDAMMTDASNPVNVRLTVGASGQVYAAIVASTGRLAGLFRSSTVGVWTQLDTPSTNEGGSIIGIHPEEEPVTEPGGQGSTHLSIVADPTDANIVYVGGDRQPLTGDGNASFPNSLGAMDYTGRLFRVNATANSGSQSTPLTHCQAATVACNSAISTSSNSAPHADSRRMVFDAAGNLLESDDGGIYRRTNPRTTGDWFSVNGNLRVNEMHDVAYDRVSNMIVSGNQDTGSAEQTSVGGTTWSEVNEGDGGDVAIDDYSSATQSVRINSSQNLGQFRRRVMNSVGSATSTTFPLLTLLGGATFVGQFVTPMELNAVDGTRLLIAGSSDLYESLDRGDTITGLGFSKAAAAIVFGGKSGGIDNASLIYAITSAGPNVNGPNVYVRTSGAGAPVVTATTPGSSILRDITVDPTNWQNAYVINSVGEVYTTPNAGGTWTNITGNLGSGATDLRSIAYIAGSPNAIVVGGVNGVFRMALDNVGVWNQFGNGLTTAPVWDLDYDPIDDTLVAGTMGRGAWSLNPASSLDPLPTLSINDVAVTEGNAGTTTANFTVTLSAASAVPVTVNYATADGTATTQTAAFTNASSISIPSVGNATPYPSNVTVSGLTGTITKVTASLNNFTHSFPADVDVLLVGPGGQSVVLMSDTGGSVAVSSFNLIFDDAASLSLPSTSYAAGTYKPTNIADGQGADAYSSPAPASGYGSALSVFNGTAPNGTWSLYVVDDTGGDLGSIGGGFTVTISTTGGDYVATSGVLTFAPSVTSMPISVTVNGDQTVEPNETFFVNLTLPSNATTADAQGQGTINNDDGVSVSAPTNVVATATTTTNVHITWNAAAGATSYNIYRSTGGGFAFVNNTFLTSYDDTVTTGAAYLYLVRGFGGIESVNSNIDLATAIIFTDPTLTTSTTVQLAHFTELLAAVNAVRALVPQSPIAFTAPTPTTSVTVRAQHLADLRTALDAARSSLALSAMSYTDSSLIVGTTPIKAVHLTEVRNGVQ
ncbi:MAG TPA: Calx-beta domain-containing protein [Thermoanaerobaculia bacterium]|nr:Calx-beta domain-containing protein [Thermoanaerobaculia bacterium]